MGKSCLLSILPPGVTGELLELENIQSSGDYTCRASNNLGVEEAVASLDVLGTLISNVSSH